MFRIESYWATRHALVAALLPLAWLYRAVTSVRRRAYRARWLASHDVGVPVIVVGNITVGGTGKTPLVAWLVEWLVGQGYRPGVVARGYGGTARDLQTVTATSLPEVVGDEPVLLARRFAQRGWTVPLRVAPDRVAAALDLARTCDVIVADDGLQHYRLHRVCEIAVIDGIRRFGNGWMLPAGPLREPLARLHHVDAIVVNGGKTQPGEWDMTLRPTQLVNLADGRVAPLETLRGQYVHAIAGIGHPPRFFATLEGLGAQVMGRVFPDHHRYQPQELAYAEESMLVMTEKDAVKCHAFARPHWWYLTVEAQVDATLGEHIASCLRQAGNRSSL